MGCIKVPCPAWKFREDFLEKSATSLSHKGRAGLSQAGERGNGGYNDVIRGKEVKKSKL